MTANQAEYSIQLMSRTLGVSRSDFYAHHSRPPSARQVADDALTDRIATIDEASKQAYGAPRIHAELADESILTEASAFFADKKAAMDAADTRMAEVLPYYREMYARAGEYALGIERRVPSEGRGCLVFSERAGRLNDGFADQPQQYRGDDAKCST